MKFRFSFLVALSAALVAGCAAYYSVFGLSQLFAGASIAVIIMASSLEFGKIVAVSLLQRYWSKLSKALRIYLVTGVFILVCITSGGIYGFLSNAYQQTASKYEIGEGQLMVLNNKQGLFDKNIVDNKAIIETKTKRVQQLNDLRTNQEARLDGAANNANRSRARSDINAATIEIQKLNTEIDVLNAKNAVLLDSSNVYATKAIEAKIGNGAAAELGPLKYLSQLTGQPMDKVVNWFILLLIFVFDPLAVSLVMATNRVLELEGQHGNEPVRKNPILKTLQSIRKKREEITPDPVEEPEELFIESPEIELPEPEPQPEPEHIVEVEPEPELVIDTETKPVTHKKEPVIPTGSVKLEEIKEIKENTTRGFSMPIPKPSTNTIERIGTNKFLRKDDRESVVFKRKTR